MLPAAINVHLYPRECSTNHLYTKPLLTFKSDMREAVKLKGKEDVQVLLMVFVGHLSPRCLWLTIQG